MADGGARLRCPDSHPKPRHRRRSQVINHGLQPIMSSGTATCAKPKLPERQRHIIEDHEDRLCRDLVESRQVSDSLTAQVHVRLRLQQPRAAGSGDLRLPSLLRAPFGARFASKTIDDHKPNVVPRVRVLAARISQADDELVGRRRHTLRRRARPRTVTACGSIRKRLITNPRVLVTIASIKELLFLLLLRLLLLGLRLSFFL